jgi:hypothetical protein
VIPVSPQTGFRADGLIGVAAIALVAIMAAWTIFSPATLYPLTAEDGPIETAQFALYLSGAFCLFQFWRGSRHSLPFFGILALVWVFALLVMAGEEISWGQRVFGFATPENMVAVNKQSEFNLHNMHAAYWLYGSDSRPMLFIELGLGVILPLFALSKPGSRLCRYTGMPVPPLALWPLFGGANLFGRLFADHFLALGFVRTVTPEIAEFLLSVALSASGFLIMRRPGIAFGQLCAADNEKRMK